MLSLLLSLIVCSVIAFYFYAKKCNNYWKERRIDVVRTNFLLGTSFDFLTGRRSLEQIFERIYREAKPGRPYVGVYNMLKPLLFVRDPDLIHRITVKDFSHFRDRNESPPKDASRLIYSVASLQGDEWKTVRNKLVSAFSSSKMKKMYGSVEECAEMLVEHHLR
jgi:cytochrome P450